MTLLRLTIVVISLSAVTASQDVVPQTISDKYNNFADKDSKITFANLPPGIPYVVDPGTYSYNGLLPLFRGVQGYVNMCFYGADPYELVLGLVGGTTAFGSETIMALASWGGGYAASIVIGLLFLIIFPIVGCCFCCCRCCCNNCGGKMVQKRTDSTSAWRCCYIITLFISCTFLGCGIICTYVVNERMTSLFSDVASTVTDNVKDLTHFGNNTVDQINYVALDGFNFTAKVMIRDMDNIGVLVGGAVQESFDKQSKITEAFDALLALDPLLASLITGLEAVDTTKASVTTSIVNLDTAMTNLANGIDTTFTNCGATCGTAPDTTELKKGTNFDPNSMPSFATELADLKTVQGTNITSLVLNGQNDFNNISGRVQAEAAPVVTTIKDMIGSFDDVISSSLGTVTGMFSLFDSITNLTGPIENLQSTPIAGTLTIGDVERYRWMGGLGLTCFVLLIFILQLGGLILGCCACCCCGDKNQLPTERGGLGNCGGIMLMSSVGLVFIFGALFMLLVWITFMIGAPMEKLLCLNLRDPEYTIFKELIEGGDPANGPYTTVLGQQDGYTLGQMVFQDPSVPLTVSGLLKSCDADAPAWDALFVDRFFNLSSVLNYEGTIDVDGEIDKLSVDLSSLEMIDASTKTQLTDMATAISNIQFDQIADELKKTTVTADLSALRTTLTTAANAPGVSGSTQTDLNNHITALDSIEANELPAVSNAQQNMLTSITNLNQTSAGAPDQINTLIVKLETTETVLQTNGVQIVKNESKAFATRVLNIADQYVNFVSTTIKNDLGRCKPVSNFYQSILVNTLCGSVIDSWNGVWFTLGWCVAFMVLGLILSVKLAKHIRKMNELHPDDKREKRRDHDYGPGKGKVHPI